MLQNGPNDYFARLLLCGSNFRNLDNRSACTKHFSLIVLAISLTKVFQVFLCNFVDQRSLEDIVNCFNYNTLYSGREN